ncbi:hypothetical protein FBUS_07644 [Fasciolopsis buskii]|uniref:Uncharacterized protein n=1 Tax=Fasciolopsis buskii TaxID=27845 RepID=A0A8E0RVQ3_9TREM|nr:hypothetical protein FBUS_07644 [Fasciolopsis buski]
MTALGQIRPFHGLGKPTFTALILFTLGFGLIAIEWFTPNQFKISLSISIEENERLAQRWTRIQRRLTTCALVGMFCLVAGNISIIYMVLHTIQNWVYERRERIRAARTPPNRQCDHPTGQTIMDKTE